MEIIRSLNNNYKEKSVVTIGTFDGVHIGHQKIIERLITTAKDDHLKSVILTFFPHPRMVLQKDSDIKLINTIDERIQIFETLGLDYLFIKTFTKEFSRLTAEEFVVDVLVKELNVKKIIIGYDHHFGRNRTANIDDLKYYGELYDFEVEEISAQDINEVSVSSTKIRNALSHGNIETVNAFLGYNFMLNGTVVKGKGIGNTIGFPTANISIKETYKLIPKRGVYIVKMNYDDKIVYGMMNIGTNPTVNKSDHQSIEVHFFNFDSSIYDKYLKIEILYRIRDEQKFDSMDSLKDQISRDKETAIQFIEQLNVK